MTIEVGSGTARVPSTSRLGNNTFVARVLRTLDARTWLEHLFTSRVYFLRLFPSKSF